MSWIVIVSIIIAVLVVTSLVIHKFFPKYKKYEPLMLMLELLSLLTMFID